MYRPQLKLLRESASYDEPKDYFEMESDGAAKRSLGGRWAPGDAV